MNHEQIIDAKSGMEFPGQVKCASKRMFWFVSEFVNERRLLLEFVGPELQIVCEENHIEVKRALMWDGY